MMARRLASADPERVVIEISMSKKQLATLTRARVAAKAGDMVIRYVWHLTKPTTLEEEVLEGKHSTPHP